jgi:hypothetical protein
MKESMKSNQSVVSLQPIYNRLDGHRKASPQSGRGSKKALIPLDILVLIDTKTQFEKKVL